MVPYPQLEQHVRFSMHAKLSTAPALTAACAKLVHNHGCIGLATAPIVSVINNIEVMIFP